MTMICCSHLITTVVATYKFNCHFRSNGIDRNVESWTIFFGRASDGDSDFIPIIIFIRINFIFFFFLLLSRQRQSPQKRIQRLHIVYFNHWIKSLCFEITSDYNKNFWLDVFVCQRRRRIFFHPIFHWQCFHFERKCTKNVGFF